VYMVHNITFDIMAVYMGHNITFDIMAVYMQTVAFWDIT
jgi:hypothetical protein